MDFNAIITALADAWAKITEIALNFISGIDWDAIFGSISGIFAK